MIDPKLQFPLNFLFTTHTTEYVEFLPYHPAPLSLSAPLIENYLTYLHTHLFSDAGGPLEQSPFKSLPGSIASPEWLPLTPSQFMKPW